MCWFSVKLKIIVNLNETGYSGLFFLTENIYEKICLRKGQIWGNLIFKNYFL